MKKLLLFVLTAALLILPIQGLAAAREEEPAARPEAPAETSAAESLSPALHAVLLAMLSQDTAVFDGSDPALVWESLYNMLSLYGQLDDRSDGDAEELFLPAETVSDYASALTERPDALGPLPDALRDRMTWDAGRDGYRLVCGNDSLAALRLDRAGANGGWELDGALTYLVDGTDLVRFHAVLQPQDNLFGCVLHSLELL